LRLWMRIEYARLMNLVRRSQRRVEHSPTPWLLISVLVVLILLAVANAGRIARMMRTRGLRVHPERSPDQAAAMWYERMARYLARRGVQKSTAQTAQEFVRVIEDAQLRGRVKQFTDAYESARFGDSADDARRLPQLYEEVETATKK
jgi:hypothetical protein